MWPSRRLHIIQERGCTGTLEVECAAGLVGEQLIEEGCCFGVSTLLKGLDGLCVGVDSREGLAGRLFTHQEGAPGSDGAGWRASGRSVGMTFPDPTLVLYWAGCASSQGPWLHHPVWVTPPCRSYDGGSSARMTAHPAVAWSQIYGAQLSHISVIAVSSYLEPG